MQDSAIIDKDIFNDKDNLVIWQAPIGESMSFAFKIRPEAAAFDPYSPGLSIDEIRARFGLERVIKMASNESPLGTSPLVQEAICRAASFAFRYVQSGNPRIVSALAEHHIKEHVETEEIVVGNGSDEIIDLLVRVSPSPKVHSVLASNPSFSMYKVVSRLCGVNFSTVPLKTDFSFDWQGLLNAVNETTAIVFITTPDNPSGYCPPVAEVESFARALPPSCILVVDEAYMDFAEDPAKYSLLARRKEFPNMVILRTFSKSFGLAGARLGYGILPKELAQIIRNVHPPFSVNLLAEEAGLAALKDTTFYQAVIKAVQKGRQDLSLGLKQLGCTPLPTQANFIMFSLPKDCCLNTKNVFEALLARGCIIRPLTSYGLSTHLRVSVGNAEENTFFLEALKEVLA